MLRLDLAGAERFVEGYANAFWDGWTMVIFKPTPAGINHRKGMRRGEQWGIANRVAPDQNGVYSFRV